MLAWKFLPAIGANTSCWAGTCLEEVMEFLLDLGAEMDFDEYG